MQLYLLGAQKRTHICFGNVQINSKNIICNGSFWLLSSKTISEMDFSNVIITFDAILLMPVHIFERMFDVQMGHKEMYRENIPESLSSKGNLLLHWVISAPRHITTSTTLA